MSIVKDHVLPLSSGSFSMFLGGQSLAGTDTIITAMADSGQATWILSLGVVAVGTASLLDGLGLYEEFVSEPVCGATGVGDSDE